MNVRVIGRAIATLIWTVFGFYIWIPAMVVSGALYVAAVFFAAFAHDIESMRSMEKFFRDCIRGYPEGFSRISRVMADDNPSQGTVTAQSEHNWFGCMELGGGFVLASVFWFIVVRLLGAFLYKVGLLQ